MTEGLLLLPFGASPIPVLHVQVSGEVLPEPTTMVTRALLLPFGASTLRMFRRGQVA